jgi:cystathionine beta-lyase/cystathionine gamma-synthase
MTNHLAISGGPMVRERAFPAWPVHDHSEEQALLEVLHSNRWGRIDGERVAAFEEAFATYQGARYGVACSSGTAALRLALLATGIEEVVVPADVAGHARRHGRHRAGDREDLREPGRTERMKTAAWLLHSYSTPKR